MDIIGGLTAAKIAIDIAKELRSIDRSLDEATYKLKLADLTSALADTQLALAEAKVKVGELESKLDVLANGEVCPKCRTGRLDLTEKRGLAMGGLHSFGVEEWKYSCNNSGCDFSTKHMNDPQSLIPKLIAKR